jgi:cell division protein FtsZ
MLGGGGEEGYDAQSPQQRGAPAAPAGGSTLFERMANLSRANAGSDEDEEEDESGGGGSLRIPRFLGRQNNQ